MSRKHNKKWKTYHLITGQPIWSLESLHTRRNYVLRAMPCCFSPGCLSQPCLPTSIYTTCCRGTNQKDAGSGGGRRRWETYLPSTAATTLQLISCSYRVLSIRSRRSDLRIRFIINTWVHTNEKSHTHAGAVVADSVRACVCRECVPHQSPSC